MKPSTTAIFPRREAAAPLKIFKSRLHDLCADFPVLTPLELAEATRSVLESEAAARPSTRVENVTAAALLRGMARREELKQTEGGHLSADEARLCLGLSKTAILERFHKGRLLGWREKQNAVRFPAWQFDEGGMLPGFEEALQILNEKPSWDEWSKILFFLSPRHSLKDKRPLDCLRDGRIEPVLNLALSDE